MTLTYLRLGLLLLLSTGIVPRVPAQIRIMPLGNSITQGNTSFHTTPEYPSYRFELWKQLIDAGIDFEYVGSHDVNRDNRTPDVKGTVYKGKTYTNVNEGHWGWRADEILKELPVWLQGYTPDVVLMHLGTNDIFQKGPEPIEQTIETTLSDISQIIGLIKQKNPDVKILLAQLIPIYPTDSDVNGYITQFNAEIPAFAGNLNIRHAAEYVYVVDQNTGFDPTHSDSRPELTKDTYDKIHPNTSGELNMATKWHEAIQNALSTLPVTISGFSAAVTAAGKVQLHWITAMERDNDYFVVERSVDGIAYEAVGRVAGSGNTNTSISYAFLDTTAPAGAVYYRLRQIDLDGAESLSAVIVARARAGNQAEMSVYPTKSKGQPVMLQLRSLRPDELVNIAVYTATGRLLKQYASRADAHGNISMTMEVFAQQVPGLYVVKTQLQDKTFSGKVLVEK
ncbi:GDSL-type esterase/lipase family protein [Pontibacter beigongshangensis]|uniref:GDSL-type esterase/lipase family protein n=1 Tax=Pontibacter beigongshangensis TaxID=2574733 RepID=UPI001650D3BD|nr:GDSL-type esterase/lipase family protein [Pontibacter beigongshangensis]